MTERLELTRPMMRCGAGLDANEAGRKLLEEWKNLSPPQLSAKNHHAFRVDAVDLKNRLGDVETVCRDRLHAWLLRIVVTSTATTSVALACRWRSRPQHHERTHAPQQATHAGCRIVT